MEELAKFEKILKKVPETLNEKEKIFFELWFNYEYYLKFVFEFFH